MKSNPILFRIACWIASAFSLYGSGGESPLDTLASATDAQQREAIMSHYRKHMPRWTDPLTPEQRELLLKVFTSTHNPAVAERLGPEFIITTLTQRFRDEIPKAEPNSWPLRPALEKAIERLEAPERVKADGRAALREGIKAQGPGLRSDTIDYLARTEGAAATDTLLRMIDDPEEAVRIGALDALAEHGRPDAASAIEQILQRRAKGLSAIDLRNDFTFKHGREAIERLKSRVQQPNAPAAQSPSPKMEPALPAGNTVQAVGTPAATPASLLPVSKASARGAGRRVTLWLWVVGLATLAVITLVLWKRRS